jgi:UDP-N-acetylmuramate dehydrogenase
MRVGGPADLLVTAGSAEELVQAATLARRYGIPWRVLGAGCNVLIADAGLRGLVIVNRAASLSFKDTQVLVDSGAMLAKVARACADAGLAGLTWAEGLPGTVGGAVVGNAGAFGGDIAGSLECATLVDPDGRIVEHDTAWFDFTYRRSRLKGPEFTGFVLVSAVFNLRPADRTTLLARGEEVLKERRTRHPAGPTMGSTFKNPADGYAGQLIEEAGLKEYRVGGASVSSQHANFLINEGDATAQDVRALIEHIQREVKLRSGVELALEVELLGW